MVGVWHWFWPHLFWKCHRMSHCGKDFESALRESRFGRLEFVFPGVHADCLWIFWNLRFDISYCIQVYHKIQEHRSGQESLGCSVACKVTHFEASVQYRIQLSWHIKIAHMPATATKDIPQSKIGKYLKNWGCRKKFGKGSSVIVWYSHRRI